jgi:hypothetical protein
MHRTVGPDSSGIEQEYEVTSRWKKGESGNPKGRTPGTGKVAKLREAIAEHVPDIIENLTKAALAGDVAASRLLLERVVPPLRASEEPVALALPEGALAEQGRAVLGAAAQGQIAPTQASALLSSLGTLAKIVEADELVRRVEALESRHGLGKKSEA